MKKQRQTRYTLSFSDEQLGLIREALDYRNIEDGAQYFNAYEDEDDWTDEQRVYAREIDERERIIKRIDRMRSRR